MITDDENSLHPGSSDELPPEDPATYPEYLARLRAIARRIMNRVKKVTDDTGELHPLQHEEPTSLPFEEPTVEAPLDPPSAGSPPPPTP